MAQKKPSGTKKKAVRKKKPIAKKVPRKAKVTASSKTRSPKRKTAQKVQHAVKKKASPTSAAKEIRSPEQSTLRGRTFRKGPGKRAREIGPGSAGQSGDLQGLSRRASVDSESVEELVQEGQFYEAEIVAGVEGALDPDQGEVKTREVPEDDVPGEYLDED